MILPSSSPAALRQGRLEQLRRHWVAALPLRATYPAIQQLRLELQFEGATRNLPAAQAHVLHPPARAFFEFPCPHADCDGEFDLTACVSAALEKRVGKAAGGLTCSGQRPDERGSRSACELHLNYALTVIYQRTD